MESYVNFYIVGLRLLVPFDIFVVYCEERNLFICEVLSDDSARAVAIVAVEDSGVELFVIEPGQIKLHVVNELRLVHF